MIKQKKYLTVADIVRLAEVSADLPYKWIRRGVYSSVGGRVRLLADRVGGRWRIHPDEWERFKAACAGRELETMTEREERTSRAAAASRRMAERFG